MRASILCSVSLCIILFAYVTESQLSISYPPDTIQPPTNDRCQDAIAVEVGTAMMGTLAGATQDFGKTVTDQCVVAYRSGLVWYTVKGNGRNLRASTCSPNTELEDTMMWVFEDGICHRTARAVSYCVTGNDDVGSYCEVPYLSYVEWCSKPDVTYYIAVGTNTNSIGNFELTVSDNGPCKEFVSNSFCDKATELKVGEAAMITLAPGVVSAKKGFDLAACGFNDASVAAPGLWYIITGTGNPFSVETFNNFNLDGLRIRVFALPTSASCENLENLVGSTPREEIPACITGFLDMPDGYAWSTNSWQTAEGASYLIYVDDTFGSYGSVGIRVVENTQPCKDNTVINMRLGGLIPKEC